jgi:hypothetical protein
LLGRFSACAGAGQEITCTSYGRALLDDTSVAAQLTTLANAAITTLYYSRQKAPFGFPLDPAKWTVEVTDGNTQEKTLAGESVWYYADLGSINISVPVGAWKLSWQTVLAVGGITDTIVVMYATLSTALDSETDLDLSSVCALEAASGFLRVYLSTYKEKLLTLATKTPYYLIARTPMDNTPTLNFYGSLGTTVLRAQCAYL